jgi:hypothetical protein
MRQRSVRALALSCLLAFSLSSLPAMAAPRGSDGGDDRGLPGITRLIKQIKKFVAVALDTMIPPNP